jgi:hypothetical protein
MIVAMRRPLILLALALVPAACTDSKVGLTTGSGTALANLQLGGGDLVQHGTPPLNVVAAWTEQGPSLPYAAELDPGWALVLIGQASADELCKAWYRQDLRPESNEVLFPAGYVVGVKVESPMHPDIALTTSDYTVNAPSGSNWARVSFIQVGSDNNVTQSEDATVGTVTVSTLELPTAETTQVTVSIPEAGSNAPVQKMGYPITGGRIKGSFSATVSGGTLGGTFDAATCGILTVEE